MKSEAEIRVMHKSQMGKDCCDHQEQEGRLEAVSPSEPPEVTNPSTLDLGFLASETMRE